MLTAKSVPGKNLTRKLNFSLSNSPIEPASAKIGNRFPFGLGKYIIYGSADYDAHVWSE